jgi:hypothetical protein
MCTYEKDTQVGWYRNPIVPKPVQALKCFVRAILEQLQVPKR